MLVRGLPGAATTSRRAISRPRSVGGDGGEVRVASVYLPNGNPTGTDKFTYKLAWMERLIDHARDLLRREIPFVLAGDYNVCPTDEDVYDPVALRDDALCRLEARARFRALLYLGLTDAYRVFHREPHRYTFWDYQAGRWHRDEGLRIDHLLLSPQAADRVAACDIDKSAARQGARLRPHADLVRTGDLNVAPRRIPASVLFTGDHSSVLTPVRPSNTILQCAFSISERSFGHQQVIAVGRGGGAPCFSGAFSLVPR